MTKKKKNLMLFASFCFFKHVVLKYSCAVFRKQTCGASVKHVSIGFQCFHANTNMVLCNSVLFF